jgi:tryptophan synthase alpha chain
LSRIQQRFEILRRSGKKGFIAYLTAGDPSLQHTDALIRALLRAGVDVLEVGVPFSDPLADGPVIQRASQRALDAGTNLTKILKMVADIREGREFSAEHDGQNSGRAPANNDEIPFVLFSYLNPVWQMGIENFARRSREAGVDGVLLTDLIPEESGGIKKVFDAHDLDLIFLIAPTSTEERIRKICGVARGFIYAVSRTGTTGTRESLSGGVKSLVERIRRFTSLPIAVGFGISTGAQVQSVWNVADAAVVGSALVQRIEQQIASNGGSPPGVEVLARHMEAFVVELITSCST